MHSRRSYWRSFVPWVWLLCLLPWALWAQQPASVANRQDYNRTIAAVAAVLGQVSTYFVDTVDLTSIHADGINYMLQQLDPYTEYMTKKEAKEFRESTMGNYGGIGAILRQRPDSTVMIDRPMKGKAADKAGLRAGDLFLTINGKDFSRTTVADVRNELRGAPGQQLRLTMQRPGSDTPFTVSFERESIDMDPVSLSMMLPGEIGYIRLSSFMGKAADNVQEAYLQLMTQKPLKGLILDLRGNGGGLLEQAVRIAGMFLPKGSPVVELKARIAQQNYKHYTPKDPVDLQLPLAVLIDEASASASEIVAGALQDYDRALVMGQKSFGKGLVQSTMLIPDSALLKLTTSRYYIPSGRCIQRIQYNHRGGSEEQSQTDSLGAPFYTQAGRIVYAAGGIMPDISVAQDSITPILGSLLLDTLTFDYVTQYVLQHPKAPQVENFSITEQDYRAYCKQVTDKQFVFASPATELLQRMKKVLELEHRMEAVEPQWEALKAKLEGDTQSLLVQYKQEIVDYINMLIIQRYYYDEGTIRYTLPKDKTVQQAAQLLRSGTFASFLTKQNHTASAPKVSKEL